MDTPLGSCHKAWQWVCLLLAQAVLPHAGAQPVTVATFNAEWLGYPANSGSWSGSRSAQIQAAAGEILAMGADIVALQEVIVDPLNGNALQDLVNALDLKDAASGWAGDYNPKFSIWWNPNYSSFPAQRQAYVWKSAVVGLLASEVMFNWLPAGDTRFASGRLPFKLTVEAGPVASRQVLQLINLHLKCCTGSDDRRLASMTLLLDELHANYADAALIVLGDFNVADAGGAYGEISDWGFYDDDDADGTPDFTHAAGAEADLSWNDIDHIMVSNELVAAWQRVPAGQRNGSFASYVSDHDIIYARLDLGPPPLAEQYDAWRQSYVAIDAAFAGKSGFEQDAEGDGLANGLEFMTGTSPIAANGSVLTIERAPGGGLRLTYRQRKGMPASSLSLMMQPGLGGPSAWAPVTPADGTLSVADATEPGFENVSLSIQPPAAAQPRFYRLEGVLQP